MEAGVTKADLDTTVGIHPKAAAELVTMRTPTRKIQVNLPAAVLSQPPIGQIGLTEEQAIKEYGDVDIFASNFRPCKATLSGLSDRVFMKLIVYAKTNKVVGIHRCRDIPQK